MPYIKINRKIINVDDYKCPICGDPVDYFTDPRRRTVTVDLGPAAGRLRYGVFIAKGARM